MHNLESVMTQDKQQEELRSENELLRLQLGELNELISIREEELDLLRVTAAKAVEMQSRLNLNLDEFYYLQDQLGIQQQKREGAEQRENALEQELVQSIEMETAFYNMRDELASSRAAFDDLLSEAEKLRGLYAEVATLKSRVTELESNLEIALLENTFLKEELAEIKAAEEKPE